MIVLGIESSCDETGVALVESAGTGVPALRAHALHSQVDMHQAYGGVVPELASRDHIRRVLPLAEQVLAESGCALADIDVVAYVRESETEKGGVVSALPFLRGCKAA